MSTSTPQPPAGWYPDPSGSGGERWWNGTAWSTETRAVAAPPAPPAMSVAPAGPAQYPAGGTPYGSYAPPPVGVWRSHADDRPLVTGMGGALRTVFAKYATFDGRATRPEFWWWTLFNAIIVAAFYLLVIVLSIGTAFAGYSRYPMGPTAFLGLIWVVLVLWGVAVIVPNLAVTVRRLRDAGFHWGFIFLALVPFGGIAVLVMCAQPSRYP